MISDPIVEEIHRVREEIAERFNNDLQAIADDARKRQADSNQTTVSLPSDRVKADVVESKRAAG